MWLFTWASRPSGRSARSLRAFTTRPRDSTSQLRPCECHDRNQIDQDSPRGSMRIRQIKAVPISYRVPEGHNVTLGIGRAVKRDAVLVKVETDAGITGWGE